ncbi:tetratricopeptide repeat protein [Coraliomargarita sp. SDUM461003]|uniref:Tetratricopeptide repeat protein n=1 Tax=Thalassobacterium maritimum TaxID=3041265 RepID=A0ABU1APE4_9BACT|nr:tetratricopeptide repeat protein [Coraliomargarita sp. SDUM461003]MDQ8206039.1 tetratricopeptide repeat protein [Coraliomargarita sp. SDUM461003]
MYCLLCLLTLSCLLTAQQVKDFPELDLPTLGTRAEAVFTSDPSEAIPYMLEIKGRLKGAMSEEYRTIYRENLYLLGLAHMRWYELTKDAQQLRDGIVFWDEFIQAFVADSRHPLAMMNRADCYFGAENWSAAVDAYLHILQLYRVQVEPQELYEILQRLVLSANEASRQQDIVGVFKEFLDPRYSDQLRLFALNTLFDRALEIEGLGALMQLVVEINRDRKFRYDLGLNLRLLNTGDRFEEDEKYLEASLLFAMVLPVEQLLFAVEDHLIAIEEQLFRRQFIVSQADRLVQQLNALRAQRLELVVAPRYTANLRWRQARVLRLMGRTYEAYFAFVRLIQEFPQHKHIEQFRYAAFLQAIECGYTAEAIVLAESYLNESAFFEFEKPIATQLSILYQQKQDVEKVADLADEFLHRFPYDPVATQMAHSLGQTLFQQGDTERILDTFPFWVEEFPEGAFVESVDYWSGMAFLFTGAFSSALTAFDRLIESNPGSIYYLEARFRRGVAYFGMAEYATAREIITAWLASAPGHALQPEAHMFLGDLDAMDALVETALQHYELVETLGGTQALIDHAYFESASLLLANQRDAEHDALLERYLDRFPASPAAAEAVLRLAEANFARGRIRAAFDYYSDGIQRFGDGIETDHVDQLIDAWWKTDDEVRQRCAQTIAFIEQLLADEVFRSEMLYNRVAQLGYFSQNPQIPEDLQLALVIRQPLYEQLEPVTRVDVSVAGAALDIMDFEILRVIRRRVEAQLRQLPSAPPASLFAEMRLSARAAGQDTLALRLLRALNLRAALEVSPVQLGQAEVDLASPATLVWIAGIKAAEDPFVARGWLLQVLRQAPESSAAARALFELGQLELELGYFDQAADFFGQIVEQYFGSELSRRAAMLRADALRSARRYEDAVAAYTLIIQQRDWRGVLWAEATFKIGLCFLSLNETGKAQGFFERTYLGYAGYPEWSAQAVLESGQLLEAQGEIESARNTYQFFLDLPAAEESSFYDAIRQQVQSL